MSLQKTPTDEFGNLTNSTFGSSTGHALKEEFPEKYSDQEDYEAESGKRIIDFLSKNLHKV